MSFNMIALGKLVLVLAPLIKQIPVTTVVANHVRGRVNASSATYILFFLSYAIFQDSFLKYFRSNFS